MKLSSKFLSIILAIIMAFGTMGLVSELLIVKPVAVSAKAVDLKNKTLKLKNVATTINGPKITWNKLTGANKYYVYRKTSSTLWKKIATVKNPVTSYTDKSVKNKVAKYSYTVKGVDKKGVVSQYNKTGLAIYFVKAPVLGDVTAVADNNIKITWAKVNNATGYYVYRKKANGKYTKIATVKNGKAVSYTDKSSKTNNTVYHYTVKAYKTVGGKAYSSAYNTTGKNVRLLKAPELKKATLSGDDYIINWKSVAGATDYAVYRGDNIKNPRWEKIGTTDTLRFRDENARGETYLYTVRSLRNSIKGSYNSKGIKVYFENSLVVVPDTTVPQPDTTVPQPGSGEDDSPTTEPVDYILENPLEAFQKSANRIHEKGIAGYKKIGWQTLDGGLQLDKADYLTNILTDLLNGYLTAPDDAEVKDNPKGSDDAMHRMPVSNCSDEYVKSATAVKKGDNYVVTIVMKDQVNPSYDDNDGLSLMSRDFLDMKDVKNEVEYNTTVSKIIKEVDGTITYKDYTITATMDKDGKFIKIIHHGIGYIDTKISSIGASDIGVTGAISLNAEYYDFEY